MHKIILTTLNARYTHCSFGLRYIYANMNELQKVTEIYEFVKTDSLNEIAEKILSQKPQIVGIGVYIWNASETSRLVKLLKKISPETIVILGGPEVSHLPLRVDFDSADNIIQGESDLEFYNISKAILDGTEQRDRIIKAEIPKLSEIKLPYEYYTDEDIKNRVIYVEASRGCPFTCEFCLSSIDKSVRKFDVKILLREFDKLWERGARHFKFVDRTFNLDIKITNLILDYFLEKDPEYFIHFEVIPDHFPDSVKEKLKLFPPASIQLEIGIQTLNTEIADRIRRKLNFKKIKENIKFLTQQTNNHLHLDLIIGLPGETIESFGNNLNTLVSLTNSEIQLGLLKKLSGTSIDRHDIEFGMVYSDEPPYEILQNDLIPFTEMQKMKRFARYWDLTYNNGNFKRSIKLLWSDGEVFQNFYNFSEWLYKELKTTYQISLNRLAEILFTYLTEILEFDKTATAELVTKDFTVIKGRRLPAFLREYIPDVQFESAKSGTKNIKRQIMHL
ncbi:Mg-protoporphyrin IX monomethyl ester oxidative cyclase [hydrothermal vent metagenome]|uniref:Mg-protoporphyrin IX monomethyl ester oxidative cyclase n=1 Tax=hydrothermal vent metagenome TaxID=652676 RepID=A0A3B1DJT8_9ZZZZ